MERRAFEPTGLVPRSIIRTLNRFFQQLKPESEAVAVQEFRISRYQVLVSVRSLIFIFFVPLLVNIFSKAFLFQPLAQYIWNNHQNEIFLNSYQENRAFLEMQDFSERIFFESLLKEEKASEKPVLDMPRNSFFPFQPENNRKAISVQQIDFQKGDCVHCHLLGSTFTDHEFRNNGLDSVSEDEGRGRITLLASDYGKFKTPGLRNIAVTGPYMHDGRFATLEQVLEHYNTGIKPHPNLDPRLSDVTPGRMTSQNIQDIVAFLNTLTDEEFLTNPNFKKP
jgi:hypothetical protein